MRLTVFLGLTVLLFSGFEADAEEGRFSPLMSSDAYLALRSGGTQTAERFRVILTTKTEGNAEPETEVLLVSVAADFVSFESDKDLSILDFRLKQFLTVPKDARGPSGEFSSLSMHGLTQFSWLELLNRRHMLRVLIETGAKIGGGEGEPRPHIWAEHELSLLGRPEDRGAKIKRDIAGTNWRYSFAGETAAKISWADEPLAASAAAGLRKFMIYRASMHPKILAEVWNEGRLPRKIEIITYLAGISQKVENLKFEDLGTAEIDFPMPDGLKASLLSQSAWGGITHELIVIAEEVAGGGRAESLLGAADYARDAEMALSSGDELTGGLAILVGRLHYDDAYKRCYDEGGEMDLCELFGSRLGRVFAGSDFGKLQKALGLNARTHGEEALGIIGNLKDRGGKHGYFLNQFAANILLYAQGVDINNVTGFHEEELTVPGLFYAAFSRNPHVTSAYKDIGDYYIRQPAEGAFYGWFFYDVGRSLPSYQGGGPLAGVTNTERRLEQAFPDRF